MNLLPFFLIGLLGAVHCVGMCGGIVGAIGMVAPPSRNNFPVAVVPAAAVPSSGAALDALLRALAYHAGRIASYTLAGALAGGLSGTMATDARILSDIASWQIAAYWLTNAMLIALGLHLMGVWQGVMRLEQIGGMAWRRMQRLISPAMKRLIPVDTAPKALAFGALWGWLPCGMVYSVLLTAMLTGSPGSGAAVMLAFGLGTLPALLMLSMGIAGVRAKSWSRARGTRLAGGLAVLGFGVLGLVRAAHGMEPGWLDLFCLTPIAGAHR